MKLINCERKEKKRQQISFLPLITVKIFTFQKRKKKEKPGHKRNKLSAILEKKKKMGSNQTQH